MHKASEYETLLSAARGLIADPQRPVSLYANVAALIKQTLTEVSWVGFYLFDGSALYLGPFQGKVACVDITLDRGVCGKAARDRKTVIVPNVHEFPGHIPCDEGSNSEIVVPIIKDQRLIGVLDLDSYTYGRFDETDQRQLEALMQMLLPLL
ncbi:MAG: GAF domain-containing protein [Bacilli bacterium]